MKVRAIDFVISHVTDVPKAVKFYRKTLGIDNDFILDDSFKGDGTLDSWTEFSTSPVTLAWSSRRRKWGMRASRLPSMTSTRR